MKERPILFSAPMVRALLRGEKTQTRRIGRFPPWARGQEHKLTPTGMALFADGAPRYVMRCPYGTPGDRLWVRETFRCNGSIDANETQTFHYRADEDEPPAPGQWKPSIFMPRHASRRGTTTRLCGRCLLSS